MCKAKIYSDKLVELYDEINQDFKYYSKEQGNYDKTLNDLIHILENETFNAAQGYKLAKRIKDTMIERRKVKDEVEALTSLKSQISNIKPLKVKDKIVTLEQAQTKRKYHTRKISTLEAIS